MSKRLAVKIAVWVGVVVCALSSPLSPWVFGLAVCAWVAGVMYGIETRVDRAAEDYRKEVERQRP